MLDTAIPPELAAAPWIWRAVDEAGAYGDPCASAEEVRERYPEAAILRERSAAGLSQRQIVAPYVGPIATWRD